MFRIYSRIMRHKVGQMEIVGILVAVVLALANCLHKQCLYFVYDTTTNIRLKFRSQKVA